MGASSNGILAYGYDLGGGHEAWKVREVDQYGSLRTDWYNPDAALARFGDDEEDTDDGDEELTAFEALIKVLYDAIPDLQDPGPYPDREEQVARHYEVAFVAHGDGYNFPQKRILAAYHVAPEYGESEPLDLAELQARAVVDDWDGKIAKVLETAGLHPVTDRPTWLLAAVESP